MSEGAPPDPALASSRLVRRAVLVVVIVVVVALVVALVVVDQRRLAREQDAVDACTEAASQAAALADRRLDGTATYLSPARVPDAGLARALLGEAALRARGPVRRAAARCAAVEVRPWHPGTAARRDNVAAYLAARLEVLDAVAADGTRYDEERPGLDRLRRRAFPDAA